ncbi:MAG: iduronate sulfatase [Gimesia sp.]|uniref:Iduronate sulfatase n=1 Tax=Gimesia maris TaxID=122 RepID=A0A3D3REU4_9PLAN|nr:iduronate sulfatase [Gimesia sp.]HCO26612.1 iduronate sulfatase [Gimesia maris]|tara:strand:+ start:29615 stop:31084 length:1470 start_codon:yes stop_codon:yes gene_type:complete
MIFTGRRRYPLAVVLLLIFCPAFGLEAEAVEKPNVLFIGTDDLRCDLACYGHPLVKTPNLDRLASRGVLFKQAYCQQALCNPSRASLMTGRRPDSLQIWNLPKHFREADPNIVTLPQLFKQNGYFTQNIGKIFHNWRQKIEGDPASWSVPAVLHYARHDDDQPQLAGNQQVPENLATAPRTERRDVPDSAYFDGRIADLAVKALQGFEQKQQPFFLAVGFWKPHLPFNPPKQYWDMYENSSVQPASNPGPPEGVPQIALHDSREIMRAVKGKLTEEQTIELRTGYLAGISYLDAQVGKLLTELDRSGLSDNTIIVFWSDHGFHLGEHSLWCKTSNFENDAHVPLMISVPHMKTAGKTSDALVELLDMYPTLVELCGLPSPGTLEGTSLVPVLEDPTQSVKPAAYTQHPRPAYYKKQPENMGVSVRTPRYRYTEWREFETGKIIAKELYDHSRDPEENTNIIEHPTDQAEFEKAVQLLKAQFPRKPVGKD